MGKNDIRVSGGPAYLEVCGDHVQSYMKPFPKQNCRPCLDTQGMCSSPFVQIEECCKLELDTDIPGTSRGDASCLLRPGLPLNYRAHFV